MAPSPGVGTSVLKTLKRQVESASQSKRALTTRRETDRFSFSSPILSQTAARVKRDRSQLGGLPPGGEQQAHGVNEAGGPFLAPFSHDGTIAVPPFKLRRVGHPLCPSGFWVPHPLIFKGGECSPSFHYGQATQTLLRRRSPAPPHLSLGDCPREESSRPTASMSFSGLKGLVT